MAKNNRYLLIYGSQTGQAQAIAEEINETSKSHGLDAELHCISATDKKFVIEREKCVVIILSTTGEGEPPDTAQKFWRRIKKRTLPNDHFANVNYTILGLGDSNYTNFCNCPKSFDKRLQELGAKHFYPPGYADDAVGLEVTAEPWMEKLWPAVRKQLDLVAEEESLSNGDVPLNPATRDAVETQVPDLKENSKISEENGLDLPEINSVESDNIENTPSLIYSSPALVNANLTVPLLSPSYLEITYTDDEMDLGILPYQNDFPIPSVVSPITKAPILNVVQMTADDALKKTLEFHLDISSCDWSYKPGDTIGVICPNDPDEVNELLLRLKLEGDCVYNLSLNTETKKKNPYIPEYLPIRATLRHVLIHYCDIRSPPKKAFLRVMVEHTTDLREKRRLQELCSKQGAEDYAQFIRKPNLSVLDILKSFKSCIIPAQRLLEFLPRLLPRPYSVASSPLKNVGQVSFAFNVLEFTGEDGRHGNRFGVCTGWLDKLTKDIQRKRFSLEKDLENLSLQDPPVIEIVHRVNKIYHLPEDLTVPIIMIGPGTGVAPFVGFLKHREAQRQDEQCGDMWLFYGCRHKNKDFLYREEMEHFQSTGILTKLNVSVSREDPESPRYVQDAMMLEAVEFNKWLERGACLYVCGDAENMAKDVNNALVNILSTQRGLDEKSARSLLMTMRLHKQYLEDVWT